MYSCHGGSGVWTARQRDCWLEPKGLLFKDPRTGGSRPYRNAHRAVRGQSQQTYLSRSLKNAQVRIFDDTPAQAEMEKR